MGSNSVPGVEQLMLFAQDTLKRCGETALDYHRQVKPHERFDEELVTRTEVHLTTLFQEHLKRTFPAHRMFGADLQTEGYTHDQTRYMWIFDPIDGVDNFQARIPVWSMSLALMENYWPIFGLILMPATGDMFHAKAGGQAYHGAEPIVLPIGDSGEDEGLIFTFSRFHKHYQTNYPGKIRNLGCTAAHLGYLAMGRADAAVVANESFKDLAAAAVIVEAAGGKIFKMTGEPFYASDYLDGQKISDHLIITKPDRLEALLSFLKPAA